MDIIQNQFIGGLNLEFEETKLKPEEYPLLINGRSRYNILEAVKLPLRLTLGLPESGTMQGLYGFDKYLVVFIGGYAYFRDLSQPSSVFIKVSDFVMPGTNPDGTYPIIYACAVPASFTNFLRKAASSTAIKNVDFSIATLGTPTCIICQNGIDQPWIIYPDGSARVTQTYTDWIPDNNTGSGSGSPSAPIVSPGESRQEYLPIGTMMAWIAPILYLVSYDSDHRLTQIFRSVSGRPLDFMICVDINGNKLPSEAEGGAGQLAFSVSFEEVTSIYPVPAPGGQLVISTLNASFLAIPDFTNTIFGEPTYSTPQLLPTGPVNQFSIADIDGDTAFIDQTGIKTYNSVLATKIEANSNPISARVARLFQNLSATSTEEDDTIVQGITAAANYNNYAMFSVQTIYGPAIVVYDITRKTFVSVDIYPGIGLIKQFASIKTSGRRYLYFITEDNQLFQYQGSTTTAICRSYFEYCTQNPKQQQKPESFFAAFTNIKESGTVQVTLYVDRVKYKSESQVIDHVLTPQSNPVPIPFALTVGEEAGRKKFTFRDGPTGWKVGYMVEWNCKAALTGVYHLSNDDNAKIPWRQLVDIRENYVPET